MSQLAIRNQKNCLLSLWKIEGTFWVVTHGLWKAAVQGFWRPAVQVPFGLRELSQPCPKVFISGRFTQLAEWFCRKRSLCCRLFASVLGLHSCPFESTGNPHLPQWEASVCFLTKYFHFFFHFKFCFLKSSIASKSYSVSQFVSDLTGSAVFQHDGEGPAVQAECLG